MAVRHSDTGSETFRHWEWDIQKLAVRHSDTGSGTFRHWQ